jgi:hypothetical protein
MTRTSVAALGRFQLQPELFLNRLEQVRTRVGDIEIPSYLGMQALSRPRQPPNLRV